MHPFDFMKGYTKGEKIAGYVVLSLMAFGLFFLFASVWGWFENDLSRAAATGTAFDHTIGTIAFLVFIGWTIAYATEWLPWRISLTACVIISALLIVLSLFAYCGWFTGVY